MQHASHPWSLKGADALHTWHKLYLTRVGPVLCLLPFSSPKGRKWSGFCRWKPKASAWASPSSARGCPGPRLLSAACPAPVSESLTRTGGRQGCCGRVPCSGGWSACKEIPGAAWDEDARAEALLTSQQRQRVTLPNEWINQ